MNNSNYYLLSMDELEANESRRCVIRTAREYAL